MAFISTDVCEEVTICDPNEIIQDCLPDGVELECDYTLHLDIQSNYFENLLDTYWNYSFLYGWYTWGSTVTFDVGKMVNEDGSEYWHAMEIGTDGDDWISGFGLLEHLADPSSGTFVVPSTYVGDLIHFHIDGGRGDDWIQGANNADVLIGGKGDDYIEGHGGDDNIFGGKDNDALYGGDGNDYVFGGKGDDYIDGGEGDDELQGHDGNDEILGRAGNDNITGGDGDDYLNGGSGNDWISGGNGEDIIIGMDGDDCIDAGADDDYVDAGAGNDRVLLGDGDDEAYGGSGDDMIEGGLGNDIIFGDDGNDLVSGGDGNDEVHGGMGDDIVRGGMGDDQLWGNEGCDQFVFCELDYECFDEIMDFNVKDRDQIDLAQSGIDTVKVVLTGHDDAVFLDLMVDGEECGRILVNSGDDADLASVFSVDTAFGTGQGAVVQIASGVMVDLPSTSVIFVEDGMFV